MRARVCCVFGLGLCVSRQITVRFVIVTYDLLDTYIKGSLSVGSQRVAAHLSNVLVWRHALQPGFYTSTFTLAPFATCVATMAAGDGTIPVAVLPALGVRGARLSQSGLAAESGLLRHLRSWSLQVRHLYAYHHAAVHLWLC